MSILVKYHCSMEGSTEDTKVKKGLKYIGPDYRKALVIKRGKREDQRVDPRNMTAAEQEAFVKEHPELAVWWK